MARVRRGRRELAAASLCVSRGVTAGSTIVLCVREKTRFLGLDGSGHLESSLSQDLIPLYRTLCYCYSIMFFSKLRMW